MRQLLYQTNDPVAITRNAEEIFNRNLQRLKSKNQFYMEMKQATEEWKFSTPQILPPTPFTNQQTHKTKQSHLIQNYELNGNARQMPLDTSLSIKFPRMMRVDIKS
ncbi:uncharacterized protein LOC106870065 [Octopus bimaculoides]|uniref:Uncharacterized protein n=1 Tax=Octopus bimaculoides TaxID=37653 RepID=A0A0L8HKG9_OCTBM|nr:uncharacterized protein LOC106870065 [Octopus bimaculoides]|eukprot:XP_014771520.1 PREDICTED: uncharacterized protein LOC106870065 [Octopus bimaculoides]